MQLTEKQLEVQKWSDKTLNFGCLVKEPFDNEYRYYIWHLLPKDIENKILLWSHWYDCAWHPMTLWRLSYLYYEYKQWDNKTDKDIDWAYILLWEAFSKQINHLEWNILTWSDDIIDFVLMFLSTLPKE